MENFEMKRVGITVSTHCNMRCKLCSVGIPYLSEHKHYPINELKKMLERYFEITSYVEKFSITGGETLLYPELPELLDYLKARCDRVGIVDIVTNGSIVPKKKLLSSAHALGNQMFFLVDDYGSELSTKLEEIEKSLSEYEIPYNIRRNNSEDAYCDGWVDYDVSDRKRLFTQAEIEERYSKCAYPSKLHFCFNIVEGKMFPCAPARRCYQLGVVNNYNEYIDLFDEKLSVDEQREKITAIYNGNSLDACAYCNGLCEDSERFVPAEQISK